jgi:phospholipid/cholesterol/gamma-HCH transport system substrate-binding protein
VSARRRRGAATPMAGIAALVVLLGVLYVVMTAANGLPWQGAYEVSLSVPDAQRLAKNSEVRIRGIRVGRISAVRLTRDGPRAAPLATLRLQVQRSAAPLTSDTRVAVRAAATLGATYLDVVPSPRGSKIPDGGVLPYHPTGTPSASVTDLLDVFDASTRRGFRRATRELASAVAGRGIDVNQTIANLAASLPDLRIVLDRLADPHTQTARLVRGLATALSAIDATGPQLTGVVSAGAKTLQAIAHARSALGSAIAAAPAATAHATTALSELTPVLNDAGAIARSLRPAVRRLPHTARTLTAALRAGPRGLGALRGVLPPLQETALGLTRLARRPSVEASRQKLLETIVTAEPLVDTLTPAQLHCNALTLWIDALASPALLTENHMAILNLFFTTLGAQLEPGQNAKPSPDLKVNFLPNENASECEAGNQDAPAGQQLLSNPPGTQPNTTRPTQMLGDNRERARRAGLLDIPRGAR